MGWGYRIDYDKAIEEDQAEIDRCERIMEIYKRVPGLTVTPGTCAIEVACEYPGAFGLSCDDANALRYAEDWENGNDPPIGDCMAWDNRGMAIAKSIAIGYGSYFYSYREVQTVRRKALARKARHKRKREGRL